MDERRRRPAPTIYQGYQDEKAPEGLRRKRQEVRGKPGLRRSGRKAAEEP